MTSIEERLESLERELRDLRSREAIRNVIHRYCRAADRCDLDAFKGCYWPDGFDDHGFFGGNAWEFCDYVIPVLRQIEASIHAITNTIIDLDGRRAFCESQWSVVHRLREGDAFLDYWHQGRYLDVFEERDGEWRILVRIVASDADRLLRTRDLRTMIAEAVRAMGGEPDLLYGARIPDDPVLAGFDIRAHGKERPAVDDLWGPFRLLASML